MQTRFIIYCSDSENTEQKIPPSLRDYDVVCNYEQLVRSWMSAKFAAVVLTGKSIQQSMLNTIDYLQARIPSAPLIVILEQKENAWELLRCGVQEVVSWSEIHDMNALIESAIVRKAYSGQTVDHSRIDTLTGFPNRTAFYENLEKSLVMARQKGRSLGLFFIDLDRFRIVNQTHGHRTGDEILVRCAQRIQDSVRKSDSVARVAGKTFAFWVDFKGDSKRLATIASKICSAFHDPIVFDEIEAFISVSIGIDVCEQDNQSSVELMHNTESALEKAKQDGRNGYKFYSPIQTPDSIAKATMENALHYALEKQQLRIAYQPQVDVIKGEFIGAEALLRWKHPVLGEVPPSVFIPALEETGLIERFGDWVIRTACQQFSQWLEAEEVDHQAKVSINLSPRQFRQIDLAEKIEAILEETHLPASNLTLEITESMLMNHIEQSIEILAYLRSLGCSVAIDDFGTGYSSLAYLKKLPVDYLKIDRMFIKDIVQDSSDAAIADSIISLAHNLGMSVIAEGVENIEALDILNELGCDHYQGFYFSKPSEPEHIPSLVKKRLPPSKGL